MQGGKTHEEVLSRLSRMFNSMVCFTIAYITFYYIYWLAMGLTALYYGLDSFVYYHSVKFFLVTHVWTKWSATVVYGVSPFLSLLLAVLSYYIFKLLKNFNTPFNLIFIWGFVVGTSIFVAHTIIPVFCENEALLSSVGLAKVYEWWGILRFFKIFLAFVCIVVGILFSVNAVQPFLSTAYSYAKVNKQSRRERYYLETVVLPFILGTLITTMATYPDSLKIHFIYTSVIAFYLIIGWIALNYIQLTREELVRYTSLQSMSVFLIFMLVGVLVFVFTLGQKIYFSAE